MLVFLFVVVVLKKPRSSFASFSTVQWCWWLITELLTLLTQPRTSLPWLFRKGQEVVFVIARHLSFPTDRILTC